MRREEAARTESTSESLTLLEGFGLRVLKGSYSHEPQLVWTDTIMLQAEEEEEQQQPQQQQQRQQQ